VVIRTRTCKKEGGRDGSRTAAYKFSALYKDFQGHTAFGVSVLH